MISIDLYIFVVLWIGFQNIQFMHLILSMNNIVN